MDIIHLLPDSVANQIAAGEVVQRPASVVKELMENAVDAGAKSVDVIIADAGRTSIRVIDDGKGMTDTDARMAFERHATSKISQAEDLFTLHTMGFRGEALPSIAAVSQVRLRTRTEGQELGTDLHIEASHVLSQEPCSCPVGADFEVSNLFFNVPARRKFLKSNQTEFSNITQEFERIALVNPSVAFSLTQGDTLVTRLPVSNLRQRIVNVFGKRLNEQMLPVDVETTLVRIEGFVGKPESARKKGANQFFFVNGRYMRHPYFHKAVMEAYAHLIPDGEQIPYFLYFTVEPANIDVNIHPTKTEIKFENDSAIWQIIVAAVRDSLGRFNAVPTIEFDVEGRPDIPVFDTNRTQPVKAPHVEYNPDYNPFRTADTQKKNRDWALLYETARGNQENDVSQPSLPREAEKKLFGENEIEFSSEHLQYKGQFILVAVRSGLMMVDQHRAHVRILYERYLRQMESQGAGTQGLLFPEMLQLPPSDAVLFDGITPALRSLGFDVSSLGGGSYSVLGIPSGLEGVDVLSLLQQMVEEARTHSTSPAAKSPDLSDVNHRLALAMARSAAIVAGQVLTEAEMDTLLGDLFQCSQPNLTPTGKPTLVVLGQEEIDTRFA